MQLSAYPVSYFVPNIKQPDFLVKEAIPKWKQNGVYSLEPTTLHTETKKTWRRGKPQKTIQAGAHPLYKFFFFGSSLFLCRAEDNSFCFNVHSISLLYCCSFYFAYRHCQLVNIVHNINSTPRDRTRQT